MQAKSFCSQMESNEKGMYRRCYWNVFVVMGQDLLLSVCSLLPIRSVNKLKDMTSFPNPVISNLCPSHKILESHSHQWISGYIATGEDNL